MPSDNTSSPPHTQPITIEGARGRRRSESVSESSSDSSCSPTSPLATPLSSGVTNPRIAPVSPSSSPLLTYFLGQSPKSSTTFPFRRGFGPHVIEDDEPETDMSTLKHARRASSAWPAVTQVPHMPPAVPAAQQDRASGLLRRLSLGGALARPPPPVMPPIAAQRSTTPPRNVPRVGVPTPRKARANTLAPSSPRPRAPSPMGERILRGHFDGFN